MKEDSPMQRQVESSIYDDQNEYSDYAMSFHEILINITKEIAHNCILITSNDEVQLITSLDSKN